MPEANTLNADCTAVTYSPTSERMNNPKQPPCSTAASLPLCSFNDLRCEFTGAFPSGTRPRLVDCTRSAFTNWLLLSPASRGASSSDKGNKLPRASNRRRTTLSHARLTGSNAVEHAAHKLPHHSKHSERGETSRLISNLHAYSRSYLVVVCTTKRAHISKSSRRELIDCCNSAIMQYRRHDVSRSLSPNLQPQVHTTARCDA